MCRTDCTIDAVILVTGAGSASGHIGLDVFLSDGQSVSVPWKEFGVSTRMNTHEHTSANLYPDAIERTLERIRVTPVDDANQKRIQSSSLNDDAELIFADVRTSFSKHRTGRNSGDLTSINAESEYRQWLSRWWRRVNPSEVLFRVQDQLTESRLQWLNENRGLNLQVQLSRNSESPRKANRAAATFAVSEDDRYLDVINSTGRTLPNEKLAEWLNRSARNVTQQVTAHSIENGRRLVLVDVASPHGGQQHDVVADGLVIAGLILHVMQTSGRELPPG